VIRTFITSKLKQSEGLIGDDHLWASIADLKGVLDAKTSAIACD
jgi:hypothetical protein